MSQYNFCDQSLCWKITFYLRFRLQSWCWIDVHADTFSGVPSSLLSKQVHTPKKIREFSHQVGFRSICFPVERTHKQHNYCGRKSYLKTHNFLQIYDTSFLLLMIIDQLLHYLYSTLRCKHITSLGCALFFHNLTVIINEFVNYSCNSLMLV